MDRSDDPDIHEILQNSLTKALDGTFYSYP